MIKRLPAPSSSRHAINGIVVLRSVARALWALAAISVITLPAQALVPLSGVLAISAGDSHTCALTSAGSVKCWGYNFAGQLGDGTTQDRLAPVDVAGLTSGVIAISVGGNRSCALTTGGSVKCWGNNGGGQLGDGTTTNRSTPVDVLGLASGIVALAAGGAQTCALTSGGGVKCWGYNNDGQLGDGTTVDRPVPGDVSGLTSGVTAIAAGGGHTCALTSTSGVRCWGYNSNGQVGNGTNTSQTAPVDVFGLSSGVTSITAGTLFTCALTTAGGVKCFGQNGSGHLGDGTTNNASVPVDVSGLSSGVMAIAAGDAHACAVTVGGGVKCWGSNLFGQVGDGTTSERHVPTDTSGLASGIASVTAAYYHTCALTSSGGVKCWGGNADGQLGNGTVTNSLVPVSVLTAASAPSATVMFVSDYGTQTITKSNPDGTEPTIILSGLSNVRGLAVDAASSKLYFAEQNPNRVRRANLDGSNAETIILASGFPFGVAIDPINAKLYWTEYPSTIRRANLDGTGIESLPLVGLDNPIGLAPDALGGKLYWTDYGTGTVSRANLDGSLQQTIASSRPGAHDLAIDATAGHVYWTEETKVMRADFDGSEFVEINTNNGHPAGVALDLGAGKIFWALETGSAVQSANLDGSEIGTLLNNLTHPLGIALLIPTNGPAAQTITFGPLPDRTYGDPTFNVSATASSGLAVTFGVTGSCQLSVNTVTLTGAGGCTVTAHQGGDTNYLPAPDVARTFAIAKASSLTSIASDQNPSSAGQGVTFTAVIATVAPVGGSVTFRDGAVTLGASSVVSGEATLMIASLAAGSHSIIAEYGGDADHFGSTSLALTQVVVAVPGAPTGVTAQALNAQATVSFTPPASDGGSPIIRYTATSSPGAISESCNAPCVPSRIFVGGLTNGVAYTFTVTATNAVGTGPASPPSNSVTPLGVPGVPTAVTATAGNAQATIRFTPPSNGGLSITGYAVNCAPSDITVTGSSSPITVAGLTNGTLYSCIVAATNAIGFGNASSPVYVMPLSGPAAFTVNNTADTVDASPGDGICADQYGNCTLRAAIIEANALSGAETIAVPAGTYTLAIPGAGENAGATGDLNIASSMTINGAGAATTIIDGGALDRVFKISGGTVAITGLTVRNGFTPAGQLGAGIENFGSLTLNQVVVRDNETNADGGGIFNQGTLVIDSSTVSSNTGGAGAGIYSFGSSLTLINSTVSGNVSIGVSQCGFGGGGLLNYGGQTTISNSTFFDNIAQCTPGAGGRGNAISSQGGATTTIQNSIIATIPLGSGLECYGVVTSQGRNIVGDSTCGPVASDTVNTDPLLGQLADNGGPTPTHAPLATSPALNGVPIANCTVASDQRGIARPQGPACDIGSVEDYLTQAPTVPTGLVATPFSPSRIDLTWSASSDYLGVTAYKVYRGGLLLATLGNVTSYSDTGLDPSTMYSYTVAACNANQHCSAQSVPVSTTTLSGLPGAPTDVIATAGIGQISVAFTPPASSGGSAITGYTATCGSQSASGTASPIIVTVLANGTSYTCTVTATNANGVGPASNPSNSVTPTAASVSVGVSSLARAMPSPTMQDVVAYSLVFAAPVSGVGVVNFAIAATGIAGASIANVTGSGTTWTITVNTGRGSGTLRLDLANVNGIVSGSTPLVAIAFTGETYQIDKGGSVVGTGQGQPNNSFGTNGYALFNLVPGVASPGAVTVLSSGKVLAAGGMGCNAATGLDCTLQLAQYSAAGVPDTSFAPGGRVTTTISGVEPELSALISSSGGTFLVAGARRNGADTLPFVAKFANNGTPAAGFGVNGIASLPSSTLNCGAVGAVDCHVGGMAVDSSGRIVIVGTSYVGVSEGGHSLLRAILVERLTTAGTLDATFGSNGIVIIGTSPYGTYDTYFDQATDLAIQPSDGKIVVGGRTRDFAYNNLDFMVMRLTATGALDTSFGTGGVATARFTVSNGDNRGRKLALQSDGRIVLVGPVMVAGGTQCGVMRFNTNGTLDAGFGVGGQALVPLTQGCVALTVQADGKIVVAGSDINADVNYATFARLLANGSPDTGFGTGGLLDISSYDEPTKVAVTAAGNLVSGLVKEDPADGILKSYVVQLGSSLGQTTTTTINGITPPSAVVGQTYAVYVTVSGVSTGSVLVGDGTGASCVASLTSGTGWCALASTTAGSKIIEARYLGTTTLRASRATRTQTVNKASTTTVAVASSAGGSATNMLTVLVGTPVTLTATVTVTAPGAGVPTGTVTFRSAGATLGTAPLNPAGPFNQFIASVTPTPALAAATYNVVATYAGDANFAASASAAGSLRVTVQSLPTVQFNPFAYALDDTAGPVVLTVTRTGNTSGSSTVNFATANGSALAGTDYTATSGSLSWAAGDTSSKSISIPIIGRAGIQVNRTFTVTLLSTPPPSGATLGTRSVATVVVRR